MTTELSPSADLYCTKDEDKLCPIHLGGECKFDGILRKKLFYLEGLADGLEDTPRRALRIWVDSVRRLINDKSKK